MVKSGWLALCLLISVGTAGCHQNKPPVFSAHDQSEFQSALDDGDPDIVDRLLSAKPGLVNVPNAAGETPLKAAERKGNQDLAAVLKRHGGHE